MTDIAQSSGLDCQSCGACCAEFDVLLTGAETDEFESDLHLVELTVLYERAGGGWRFMKRDAGGRCVALSGPLAKNACTIYERRPFLCRDFAAGSRQCHEARLKILGIPIPADVIDDSGNAGEPY